MPEVCFESIRQAVYNSASILMNHFLVDANLPYHFSLWNRSNYIHINDLDKMMSDSDIWELSRINNYIIITKDTDFSNRILSTEPPPKVIHVRVGNMTIKELHAFLNRIWPEIVTLVEENKLVNIYSNRIEAVK